MRTRSVNVLCPGLAALVGGTGVAAAGLQPGPVPRDGEVIQLERVEQLVVTTRGRILRDTSGRHAGALGRPIEPGAYAPRFNCPQNSQHTDASFTGGSFVVQAGFAENETAAASYTLSAASFPLRVTQTEMIFATAGATVATVTEWCWLVWEGRPDTGSLIAQFCSDDVVLPHIRLGPGTNGVNVQVVVDPADPQPVVVGNAGAATFSVGYSIVRHHNQTGNPCFVAPSRFSNAFPVTDVSGLAVPAGNWLEGVNCGPFGCPPNGGFRSFQGLSTLCRPTGDWVMRATWDPQNCPGQPGACCTVTGGCVLADAPTCVLFGGLFAGAGTTCEDRNGDGQADFCVRCPCAADFDRSGGTPDGADVEAFFVAWIAGDAASDVDCSQGTPDGSDINEFFAQWIVGGC